MENKISYQRIEVVEALATNNNIKRNPAVGEKLTFAGFCLAELRGITWKTAIFDAADGRTMVSVPLSKLPNWQVLKVGQDYYVKEATRHYVLVSSYR